MAVAQSSNTTPAFQVALTALEAGMSVLPIRADGTKQPALARWKPYQRVRPTEALVREWFRHPQTGLALVTGAVSGGLEALDFDTPEVFETWLQGVQSDAALRDLYEHVSWGYLESTPNGGRHLLYRCSSQIEGNQKLARVPVEGPEKVKTLIETRGEGGLIIVEPSRGRVHSSGRPYRLLRGGVAAIITITAAERLRLLESARALDKMPPVPLDGARPVIAGPAHARVSIARGASSRPGDLFNARATWEQVLCPCGWEPVETIGEVTYWRRPGKTMGVSATTNYGGSDLLYVFSTSSSFDAEQGYSKFRAYALLNHGGDFSAAARALAEQGYTRASGARMLSALPS